MIQYPKKLEKIFDKLHLHGIRPIIVGGYVRDFFLKTSSKDIDIEVYNISSFEKLEDILKEFGTVNTVGKSFGVCKLFIDELDLDFSFPRLDNKIADGHKGFDVQIRTDLDYKSASSRRDFSINSIGFDVIKKEILDPFNGLEDLKNSTLRAIDANKFQEDPLRVLRGVQFCARFDLAMDDDLFKLCQDMVKSKMLEQLSKNRVFTEIKKLLLKAKKPSKGFILIKKLGILNDIPELNLLSKEEYENTILILDEIAKLNIKKETRLALMLSIFSYSFEKTLRNKNDFKKTKIFIENWSDEKELLKHIIVLVRNYILIKDISIEEIDDYFLYKLATKVKIEEVLMLGYSYCEVQNDNNFIDILKLIEKNSKQLNILEEKMPDILHGRDILSFNIKPSKEFSTILADAYDAQIKKTFTTHTDAMIWLKSYLITHKYL